MRKEEENRQMVLETAGRIRKARERLGLTQEQAAERSGLSAENYKKIEEGNNAMSIDSLRKIQRGLEVSFDYILSGATDDQEALWKRINACDFHVRMMLFARLIRQFSGEDISEEEVTACVMEAFSEGTYDD